MTARDDDLKYHAEDARETIIQIRDLFDAHKDSNPRWLPGALFEEMHARGIIDDEQHDRMRKEIGL